jgi:molybdenum cofactor cytidylyltransferase
LLASERQTIAVGRAKLVAVQPELRPALSFGVVILGAGAASRMGQPKLLLPWRATTVLGHLIEQWEKLSAQQIAVVCAAGDQAVEQELTRLGLPVEHRIVNPTPALGMFSSIQCAAGWTGWKESLTHWVIVLGDQPHLRNETLRGLLEFATAHPEKICQPSRHGRARHPVVLPAAAFRRLRTAPADNLKQFLQSLTPHLIGCEIDDPGLDLDIDQPADYAKAVQLDAGIFT